VPVPWARAATVWAVIRIKAPRAALLALASLALLVGGPVAGASASKGSIRTAIAKSSPKILEVEGRLLTVEGEYNTTHDPVPVEAAIDNSVAVLSALRHKVAAQSAAASRIKAAKHNVVVGLEGIIVGYGHLKAAFADRATDPEAATTEAKAAVTAAGSGKKQFQRGIKQLS
jgi:hypothetical protein